MSNSWEFIAQCLRAELAEYGGLIHLFEAQQASLSSRDPEAVLGFATRIESQARSVANCRQRREQAVAEFAEQNGWPVNSSLRAMLSSIEADARPLLKALITEVDLLLRRVRRTSRHNHTLLSRAVEMHQEALQHLRRQTVTKTYPPAGRIALSAANPPLRLRVAG